MAIEDDYQSKELQTLALEKQTILEFESHLAAASTKAEINEQTSLLLPQLMELNPFGDARRPPPHILDLLQTLNNSHRLGHLLCKSRHPDFLLEIMTRQGGKFKFHSTSVPNSSFYYHDLMEVTEIIIFLNIIDYFFYLRKISIIVMIIYKFTNFRVVVLK